MWQKDKVCTIRTWNLNHEFSKHLSDCRIVSQLTPLGTPQIKGVSERHKRTLFDMVRSMMSFTDLPLSFWGYALETATYTLNRALSKSVDMTPWVMEWEETLFVASQDLGLQDLCKT